MAPWSGPRHRSWARDTNWSIAFAVVVVVTYIVWEIVATAPQGMVTLVGLAGGAVFGAVSGDKKKREHDTELTAEDAQATAQRAEATANNARRAVDAGEARADAAERRETEPSLHEDEDRRGSDQ